jgi:hypothetical protein
VAEVPAALPKQAVLPNCSVADFRALGMETSNVEQRRAKALTWLAKHGKQCSAEKLVAIRNNRAQWMGTADSNVVAGVVDTLLEQSAEGNPEVINMLYGTAKPPPKPPEDGKTPAKPK